MSSNNHGENVKFVVTPVKPGLTNCTSLSHH